MSQRTGLHKVAEGCDSDYPQRIQLAEELWDSLEPSAVPLTPELAAELRWCWMISAGRIYAVYYFIEKDDRQTADDDLPAPSIAELAKQGFPWKRGGQCIPRGTPAFTMPAF